MGSVGVVQDKGVDALASARPPLIAFSIDRSVVRRASFALRCTSSSSISSWTLPLLWKRVSVSIRDSRWAISFLVFSRALLWACRSCSRFRAARSPVSFVALGVVFRVVSIAMLGWFDGQGCLVWGAGKRAVGSFVGGKQQRQ